MATHEILKLKINKFWDNEFKSLDYVNEEFNDTDSVKNWINIGYSNKFTGDMCDMRSPQPSWNSKFIEYFEQFGWKDIGTSYYRMMPGTVLPTHSDLYLKYIDLFNLHGKEDTIRRAIVFLEDWKPGHYFEGCGKPTVEWSAGDCVVWAYDAPHLAANVGVDPRYTLQITGHI
jgi:hypothetical protein